MTQRKMPQLSQEQRKEVFRALVDAQDQEMDVLQSRKLIAQQFGLTDVQVKQIEEEGLEGEWPPL